MTLEESDDSAHDDVAKAFDDLVARYGRDPKAGQWRDQESQRQETQRLDGWAYA